LNTSILIVPLLPDIPGLSTLSNHRSFVRVNSSCSSTFADISHSTTGSMGTASQESKSAHNSFFDESASYIYWQKLRVFLAGTKGSPYDPMIHRPGTIVRTNYNNAPYVLISRSPGEGLD